MLFRSRADSSPLTRLLHPNVGRDRSPPVSLAKMDDDEIRGEIQLLIEASEGSIGLSELGSQTPSREAPPPVLRELASAPVTRATSLCWRHSRLSPPPPSASPHPLPSPPPRFA